MCPLATLFFHKLYDIERLIPLSEQFVAYLLTRVNNSKQEESKTAILKVFPHNNPHSHRNDISL